MIKNNTVIVGNGVAACSCAISLAKQGLDVTLLKRKNPRRETLPVGEHLPPEGKTLLQTLGLNDVLTSQHHRESSGVISYWTGLSGVDRNYLFNPLGHGINLDRTVFNNALLKTCHEAGVHIVDIERVNKISRQSSVHKIEITAAGKSVDYHANFLIDATGRSAIAARQLGAHVTRDDKLVGIYSYLKNVKCLDNRLIIEALQDGWWYTAPLQNNHIVAVFMTDSDLMPTGLKNRKQFWVDRLTASSATLKRLGKPAMLETFQIADAATQYLSQNCGDNWIAIGDAAMAFDPISAAGMTKALSSGIEAANAIIQHYDSGFFNPKTYQQKCTDQFQTYKNSAHSAYAQVNQFSDSEFWNRRQRR